MHIYCYKIYVEEGKKIKKQTNNNNKKKLKANILLAIMYNIQHHMTIIKLHYY